jgi:hypothetical protein
MNVRGLTKAAQKMVKSPAAKKRAIAKAKAMCRIVAAPGRQGIDAATRLWTTQREEFAAGVNPALPLSRQHAWDLNRYLDIAAQSYAYVLCPSQGARLDEASELSLSEPTLNGAIGDLAAFVNAHGSAVVAVTCAGVTISGVVIVAALHPEAVNAGMKSTIASSQYGLDACLDGDFLDRRVSVKSGATEFVGYIWSWGDDKDVASIVTSAVLTPVREFTGSVVPRPSIGDTAVLVWGQAGSAGRAQTGTVVLAESDFLYTTNSGPGSYVAGAAVFNNRGDLLGIVDSSSIDGGARTITVLPVTRFCGEPYSTSCYIGWKS